MTNTAGTDLRVLVTYDHQARAQYQTMSDKPIAYTVEDWPRLIDYAADDTIVGIETLV